MKRREMKGFTLIEIVASVIVITVLAVGLMATTFHTKRSGAILQQKMIAIQLIDKKLAEIKKDDGRSVISTIVPVPELKNGGMKIAVKTAPLETGVPNNPFQRFQQVIVTVGWDFPWTKNIVNPCKIGGSFGQLTTCDKEESLASVFFSETT